MGWREDVKLGIARITDLRLGAGAGQMGKKVDVNAVAGMWSSFTTSFTDGTDGTGTVQFVFKDAAGVIMTTPVSGTLYFSEVATGLTVDALDTGIAVLTNGVVTIVDTGAPLYYNFVTTAAGLFGLTITSAADSYWMCVNHMGGLKISDEMAITGP